MIDPDRRFMLLTQEFGPLEFTAPFVDRILYVNGEPCFELGHLDPPNPYIIGNLTIREAALNWNSERQRLIASMTEIKGRPYGYMEKENANASVPETGITAPAGSDARSSGG